MDNNDAEISTETVESLQADYHRLFTSAVKDDDFDSQNLAQPYPLRYVQSVTTGSIVKICPLILILCATALADSKSDAVVADLRTRLAAEKVATDAARASAAKAQAALVASLQERAKVAAKSQTEALVEHVVTVNKVDRATEEVKAVVDNNLIVSEQTRESADNAAKSADKLVTPLWFTFGMAIVAMFGSLIGYLKTRQVNASTNELKISVNGRMDELMRERDKLMAAVAVLQHLHGNLEGKAAHKAEIVDIFPGVELLGDRVEKVEGKLEGKKDSRASPSASHADA